MEQHVDCFAESGVDTKLSQTINIDSLGIYWIHWIPAFEDLGGMP